MAWFSWKIQLQFGGRPFPWDHTTLSKGQKRGYWKPHIFFLIYEAIKNVNFSMWSHFVPVVESVVTSFVEKGNYSSNLTCKLQVWKEFGVLESLSWLLIWMMFVYGYILYWYFARLTQPSWLGVAWLRVAHRRNWLLLPRSVIELSKIQRHVHII